MADDLVPIVDYTSKDYVAFRDDMLAYASVLLPEWTSRSPNDFGVVLVELFAYMGDILSFYGDRIANEAFLQTATQRSSVLGISRMLDYRPNGPTASKVQLTFTTAPGSGSITIPAGTKVATLENPVYFETDADLVISGNAVTPAVYSGTIGATEGETVFEQLGTSDGGPSQEFLVQQSPVIENSLDIFMDEGDGEFIWTWVDHLIEWGPGDRVYTTYVDENGLTHVVFGDGVNGKVPAQLTVISAGYRIGGGLVGNVGPKTITVMEDTVVGVLSVSNASAAFGGQDAESVDQIRVNAPASLLAMNRAVTLQDYESLSLNVPGIGKAKAISSVYTNVSLYVAPLGGGIDARDQPVYASPERKTALRAYLDSRKPVSTSVTLLDPTYIRVNVTVDLVVAPQYNQKSVENSVKNAVLQTFVFDYVNFGDRISLGEVFASIVGVTGVGYATVTLLARGGASGVGDVVMADNEIPVPGTVTVNSSGGITL